MTNEIKRIIDQFRTACDALAGAVNEQLFEGCRDWWWIGDTVGGMCCFDDTDDLNPDDMVLILEKGITYEQYEEWHCANLDNGQYINLPSWLKGCRHYMLTKKTKDHEEENA